MPPALQTQYLIPHARRDITLKTANACPVRMAAHLPTGIKPARPPAICHQAPRNQIQPVISNTRQTAIILIKKHRQMPVFFIYLFG